jgi:hypothetical protein
VWRRLTPREIDHEVLWLWVTGATACWFALVMTRPEVRVPLCVFKQITGWPCPTCGTTRAVLAALRADVPGAFAMNPLMTVMAMAAGAYLVYAAIVVGFRLPRFRPLPSPSAARLWRMAAIAVVTANWAYLIAVGR